MYKKVRPTKEWLEKAYLVEMKSTSEIAEICGVTSEAVRKWLMHYGIPLRSRSEALLVGTLRPPKEWLENAYNVQLKTIPMIAIEKGVPKETVMSWMRLYEIPRRKGYQSTLLNGGKVGGWNKINMPPPEEIIKSYVTDRKSTVEMAVQFGVSPSTALHWVKACNIPVRPYKESSKVRGNHLNETWLRDQYFAQKKSMVTISQETGVSKKTLLRTAKGFGMKLRTTSEALRNNPKRSGENNPAWKGGLSSKTKIIRYSAEYLEACRIVRRRDKGCLLCISKGIDPKGKNHEVHHIDPISAALLLVFDPGNMILLCEDCHLSIRGKEEKWRKRLFNLIQNEA